MYIFVKQFTIKCVSFLIFFTGVISWASIVPFDVIKSRIQADSKSNPVYKSTLDCIIQSKKEGIMVFFRGFWMIAFRAFPVNAATFLGYEMIISFCESKNYQDSI